MIENIDVATSIMVPIDMLFLLTAGMFYNLRYYIFLFSYISHKNKIEIILYLLYKTTILNERYKFLLLKSNISHLIISFKDYKKNNYIFATLNFSQMHECN